MSKSRKASLADKLPCLLDSFGGERSYSMYRQRTLKDLASEWIPVVGYKATAQKLFRLLNLFPTPLLIFPCGTSLSDIESNISRAEFSGKELAIRFSRLPYYSLKEQVNAPRLFSSSPEDILAFIGEHWATETDAESSIIVQPGIDLAYSYELSLERQGVLVEVLPGLWELDNMEPVDRIIISERGATIQRYTYKRDVPCWIDSSKYCETIPPVSFEFLTQRYFQIVRILPILYLIQDCLSMDRTNFHFLEDHQQGFHFLNARLHQGFAAEERQGTEYEEIDGQEMHRIASVRDIRSWNRESPVLFEMTAERERSADVMRCIESLMGNIEKVYVRSGLLSHTAILLRECGFEVRQLVTDFETRVIENPNSIFSC